MSTPSSPQVDHTNPSASPEQRKADALSRSPLSSRRRRFQWWLLPRPARCRRRDVARSGDTARKSACATSGRLRRGAMRQSTVRSKVYFRRRDMSPGMATRQGWSLTPRRGFGIEGYWGFSEEEGCSHTLGWRPVMMTKISLDKKFSIFEENRRPRVIVAVNGQVAVATRGCVYNRLNNRPRLSKLFGSRSSLMRFIMASSEPGSAHCSSSAF